jgi:hypothetical protein
MHFESHPGQRDLHRVDAVEYRADTLQVDCGWQLMGKVLSHGCRTRLQ